LAKESSENGIYSTKSDIFSLGIVFYELMNPIGRHPFSDGEGALNPLKTLENIKKSESDLRDINGKNSLLGERWLEFLDLIKNMISSRVENRKNAKDLKEHVFFADEAERCNLINRAQKILSHQSVEIQRKVSEILVTDIFMIIPKLQEMLPEAQLPGFKNWD
jgi:serine/threonine protein kinase